MDKKHLLSFLAVVLAVMLSQSSCSKKHLTNDSKILLQTDRYYSTVSAKEGMNKAFISMFDSAGVLIRANHMPYQGLTAISKLLLSESDSTFILTWEPISAEIASSGDLGYTYGTYTIRNKATDTFSGEGTYATIWKKQSDGKWKAVLDTGNPGLGRRE